VEKFSFPFSSRVACVGMPSFLSSTIGPDFAYMNGRFLYTMTVFHWVRLFQPAIDVAIA